MSQPDPGIVTSLKNNDHQQNAQTSNVSDDMPTARSDICNILCGC